MYASVLPAYNDNVSASFPLGLECTPSESQRKKCIADYCSDGWTCCDEIRLPHALLYLTCIYSFQISDGATRVASQGVFILSIAIFWYQKDRFSDVRKYNWLFMAFLTSRIRFFNLNKLYQKFDFFLSIDQL